MLTVQETHRAPPGCDGSCVLNCVEALGVNPYDSWLAVSP
jgi:hypothetical protein